VGEDLGRGGLGSGDAGGDADPVVGGARHGQAWLCPDRLPDSGDALEVADVVLRQPAAPPGDAAIGGGGDTDRVAEFFRRERDQVLVVALQQGDLTGAADRTADNVYPVTLPRQVRPLHRGERGSLHGSPVHRRHQVAAAAELIVREIPAERERDDRHARIRDTGEGCGGGLIRSG
jgi:hypothetical protein